MKINDLSAFEDIAIAREIQIKVCCTCVAWSPAYKGTCLIDKKGVGKFWFCEKWEKKRQEE